MPDNPLPRRARGRPRRIDRNTVLDAATRLLDAEGHEALTMRRLADDLGVSPMALYRHVGGRDELLVALIDRLAARVDYPPRPADPQGALLVLWSTLYDALAEHPWIVDVLSRRRMIAPSVLGALEEIHAALCAAGLSIAEAVRAYRLLWHFTVGSLLVRAGEAQEGGAPGGNAPRREAQEGDRVDHRRDGPGRLESQQQRVRGAPDPERYPTLAAAAAGWTEAHGRDTYLADLEVLVAALTRIDR